MKCVYVDTELDGGLRCIEKRYVRSRRKTPVSLYKRINIFEKVFTGLLAILIYGTAAAAAAVLLSMFF